MRARLRLFVSRAATLALVAATVFATSGDAAQFRQRRGGFEGFRTAAPDSFDGHFNFCRISFQSNRGRGGGWGVDYPQADVNLSIRLSELTRTRVSFEGAQEPRHFVVRLTDDTLFQCPFTMMTEVGGLYLDEEEAPRLREYLVKGGFLWTDDFWGSYSWRIFETEIRKALPAAEYPLIDLPLDHPIFRTQFEVPRVRQIPSINYWWGSGGGTSEGGRETAEPHARAIVDSQGRVMVLITHNTDYGDSWEREAEDPAYFLEFAIDGYAFGINAVLYAMTH
ncbi:MAG: DUF4159 domain-containing protein [Vicinamibacterales bacterium]